MDALPGGAYFVDRRKRLWVQVRHHRLVLMRDTDAVWRSTRSHRVTSAASGVPAFQVSGPGIAYQVRRTGALWIAPGRGAERRVSTDEWPEMWTASGNLITVRRSAAHRYAFLLRDRSGRLLRTLASHLSRRELDTRAQIPRAGALLFWNAAGQLVWTDGSATHVLASTAALGFAKPPSVYPMHGGLIELLSRTWHEVILRSDGSVFARASGPTDGSVCCFGEQQAADDGSAVAYALTDGSSGKTRVYLLRAGDRRGQLIYHVAKGKGLPPTWHGRWVLFVDLSGKVVAIDTSVSPTRTIDLTGAIGRLRRGNGEARGRFPHWSFASGPRLVSR